MDRIEELRQQIAATQKQTTDSQTVGMSTTTASGETSLTPMIASGMSNLLETPATAPPAASIRLATTPQTGGTIPGLRVVRIDSTGAADKCRQRIGKSDVPGKVEKLCFLPRLIGHETCGARHQGTETKLLPNHLYILGKGQVFLEPALDISRLKENFIGTLLGKTATYPEWNMLIVEIDLATRWLDLPDKLGEPEFNIWKRESVSPPKATPGRLPVDASTTPDSAVVVLSPPSPGVLPGTGALGSESNTSRTLFPDEPDVTIFKDEDVVPIDSEKAKEAINKAGRAITLLHHNLATAHDLYADDLRKLHGQVTTLNAMVGHPVAGAPGANPTIWTAIADLESKIEKHVPSSAVTEKSFNDTIDPLQLNVTSNASQISSLSKESQDLKSELQSLKGSVQQLLTQVQDAYGMLLDLYSCPIPHSTPPTMIRVSADYAFEGNKAFQDILDKVSTLAVDVRTLKAQRASSGVINIFPNYLAKVQTFADMVAWVKIHFRVTSSDADAPAGDAEWLREVAGSKGGTPNFGPFVDYGGLLAVAEDLYGPTAIRRFQHLYAEDLWTDSH